MTVEYGADLHTATHGSGFPTKFNAVTNEEEVRASIFSHIIILKSALEIFIQHGSSYSQEQCVLCACLYLARVLVCFRFIVTLGIN